MCHQRSVSWHQRHIAVGTALEIGPVTARASAPGDAYIMYLRTSHGQASTKDVIVWSLANPCMGQRHMGQVVVRAAHPSASFMQSLWRHGINVATSCMGSRGIRLKQTRLVVGRLQPPRRLAAPWNACSVVQRRYASQQRSREDKMGGNFDRRSARRGKEGGSGDSSTTMLTKRYACERIHKNACFSRPKFRVPNETATDVAFASDRYNSHPLSTTGLISSPCHA